MGKQVGNITIWINPHRRTEIDGEAAWRGKATIDGKDFEVALWTDLSVSNIPVRLSGIVENAR